MNHSSYVRKGIVIDEVQLRRVLDERQTPVDVDDAHERVFFEDFGELCKVNMSNSCICVCFWAYDGVCPSQHVPVVRSQTSGNIATHALRAPFRGSPWALSALPSTR